MGHYLSRPLQVAVQLRREYNLIDPPINPGLVTVNYPMVRITLEDWNQEVSGVFVRGQTLSFIGLNRNHSAQRRQFTLWHEWYHYLEHDNVYLCEFGRSTGQLEREANLFAAHFLMPEEWVRNLYEITHGNIGQMARRLGVSMAAMNVRMEELRLVVCNTQRRYTGRQGCGL